MGWGGKGGVRRARRSRKHAIHRNHLYTSQSVCFSAWITALPHLQISVHHSEVVTVANCLSNALNQLGLVGGRRCVSQEGEERRWGGRNRVKARECEGERREWMRVRESSGERAHRDSMKVRANAVRKSTLLLLANKILWLWRGHWIRQSWLATNYRAW